MSPTARARAFDVLAIGAAWSCYLPIGFRYPCAAGLVVLSWLSLRAEGRVGEIARAPGFRPALALWLLLVASMAWTVAPPAAVGSHLWSYAWPLMATAVVAACPARSARRALRHFGVASALAGFVIASAHLGGAAGHPLLAFLTDADGNQRIVLSLLLALGASLAVHRGLDRSCVMPAWQRAGWLAAAALAALALGLQDRRSGMLALPLLLAALAWTQQRALWRRAALLGAMAGLAALTWQQSDGVRARFDEGFAELRHYRASDDDKTSWGQRMRLYQKTAGFIAERPLFGHGVGSWRTLWSDATMPTAAVAQHTTPHNEVLMVATQAGSVGAALLVWLFGAQIRHAWRSGPAGVPALLVWLLLAWASLFNAALRDTKFSVPLLVLAALGAVLARPRAGGAAGPVLR